MNLTSEQTLWSVATDSGQDMTVLVGSTQKLQLTCNVGSLYPYIEWVVDVPPSYIEAGLLIVGSKLIFTFNEEKLATQIVVAAQIDSFQYVSMNVDTSAASTVVFKMSTPYKFLDEVECKAYYGNVREILETVCNEELIPCGAISALKVVKGIDTPMKRFRTYQTTKEFIETRLADSYRGEEETYSYIFTDLSNTMYAYHTQGALTELPIYYCFHEGNHNLAYLAELSKIKTAAPFISMMQGLAIYVNEKGTLWQAANAGISMLYRTNTPKKLHDFPVFRMFPPMDIEQNEMLPITASKSKDYSSLTKVYIMDDQNDYSKEYTALSTLRNEELFSALRIEVVTDMNLNINAGHICKLFPPSFKATAPILASIFEGNWLISEVSHILQGTKGKTHLTLQATSLTQRGNRDYDARFYRQEDNTDNKFSRDLTLALAGLK